MVLYYSGATSPDASQISPEKSLGGFASSTPIPNGRLSNLFSTISKSAVLNNKTELRLIVLKNTTGNQVTNVSIYTVITGSSVKLKIAAVSPAVNNCGQYQFEQVFESDSLPYQATLDYHEGSGNAITFTPFAADAMIGIWVLREIDPTKFPENNQTDQTLTCQQIADLLTASPGVRDESINLIVSYT